MTGRGSGTVIPPPLVRGGQHVPSKHNSQIVMPPLVRGAQVSLRNSQCVDHHTVKFWSVLVLGRLDLNTLLVSRSFDVPGLSVICDSCFCIVILSACYFDSSADSKSTSAAATAQWFRPPSTPACSQGFRAQCPCPGPEDHSAGAHSGG